MKTEEKARKCWCPFAFIPGQVSGRDNADEPTRILGYCAQNRGLAMGQPVGNTRCIASECMAWRDAGYFDQEGKPAQPNKAYDVDSLERMGYCGLAGKP